MAYDKYLPDDCQGSDPSFPWNQTDEYDDEPLLSHGSHCCSGEVMDVDGVIICQTCQEACEETFETIEEMYIRLDEQKADREQEAAISRWEDIQDFRNSRDY